MKVDVKTKIKNGCTSCYYCQYGVPNYTVDGPIMKCSDEWPWMGMTEMEAMIGCKMGFIFDEVKYG